MAASSIIPDEDGLIFPENRRFFTGNEIDNIARELGVNAADIEEQLFACINYAQFIFRIAEILEISNVSAIESIKLLLFDSELGDQDKTNLSEKVKNKDVIAFNELSHLKRKKFKSIIDEITKLSSNEMMHRRIEHALLDCIFYDLNEKENLFTSRLMTLLNGDENDDSLRLKLIRLLEKNSFLMASRDYVKSRGDARAKYSLDAYRTGLKYKTVGNFYWDTSAKIRDYRKSILPAGVNYISVSPNQDRNTAYGFDKGEVDMLNHYFEYVKKAEIRKGNCFQGAIKGFYDDFLKKVIPEVDRYLSEKFGRDWEKLRHIIITGIGGNEMVAHLIQSYARLYNTKLEVHLLTFPTKWDEEIETGVESLLDKKGGITADNTAVIALTRSGKTYETARTCEFILELSGNINLIGVANGGKVIDLVKKYNGLAINFPPGIAGRLSTFNTPVFALPMSIADRHAKSKVLDSFFKAMIYYDDVLSINHADSLAWELAKKIYIAAYTNGMNLKIYQGSNSGITKSCFRHMEQVIMEGIKHNISCMLPKSMPDAAHFNMEQTLKFGESFYHFWIVEKSPLKSEKSKVLVGTLNPNEQLAVLTKGQFEKIKLKSPLDIIFVDDIYDVDTQAFIYKLVENTIYYLARLLGDDPEGNPDVKDVRDLTAQAEQVVLKQKADNEFDMVDFFYGLED